MVPQDDLSQASTTKRFSSSGKGPHVVADSDAKANADEETKERRRQQNRIAQRNHRRRKAAERAHSISSGGVEQSNKRCGRCGTEPPKDKSTVSQNKRLGGPMPGGQSVDVLPTPTDSLQNPVFSLDDMEFDDGAYRGPIFSDDGAAGIEASGLDGLDDAFLELEAGDNLAPEYEGSVGKEHCRSDASSSDGAVSPKRRRDLPSGTRGCRGQLALHLAAQGGYNSIINVLLSNGARLNLTDEQGRTALHYAVEGGHVETLKLLLSWGADSLVLDSDGLSGLHLATSTGDERMVRLLMAYGADPNLRAQRS